MGQINRNSVVNQHLLNCIVLLHNSLDHEEGFIVHGLCFCTLTVILIIMNVAIVLLIFKLLEVLHVRHIEVDL